jgi:hypothetical protein
VKKQNITLAHWDLLGLIQIESHGGRHYSAERIIIVADISKMGRDMVIVLQKDGKIIWKDFHVY